MKDRQFMVMLTLAVVAGLLMGLLAFRPSPRSPAASAAAAVADGTAPNTPLPPSSDEQVADSTPEVNTPSTPTDAQDGGPSRSVETPPPAENTPQ